MMKLLMLTPFRWLFPVSLRSATAAGSLGAGGQPHFTAHLPFEEVAHIPDLSVTRPPLIFDAEYLLGLGEKVVQWLSTRCVETLAQAWKAVQRFILQHTDLVWRAIRTHPYVTSASLVTVAAATLIYLLRRKIQDFAQATARHLEMKLAKALEGPDGKGLEWELTPPGFSCPITFSVMSDPVITPDGHTYERSAIMRWITEKGTDPTTRRPLTPEQLYPNRSLRDAIEQWERIGSAPF